MPGRPGDHRGRILVALVLTTGLSAMDGTIVATAVPSVVADLGGLSLFAWVFSIYLLTQTVTIPIYGKLADLYGRKPILLLGIGIFLAGSVACAAAPGMISLIVFRGVQGLGAGAIQATVTTVAGDLYDISERGRVQGWLSSVWGVAAVIGPAAGGLFSQYLSWRWIFVLNVPLGAFAAVMLVRHLHENVTRSRHRIDYAGAALLLAATGTLIFGLLRSGIAWPWLSAPSLAVFAAALVLALAAALVERRAAEPVMPGWLWTRRHLAAGVSAMVLLGLMVIGVTTIVPSYVQQVTGLGPTLAGFTLAAMSVTWPLSAALASRLYLRIGFRDTALIGAGLCAVAATILILLPASGPALQVLAGTAVLGAGCGLISTPLVVGLQSTIGWGQRGVVTGSLLFGRYLGQSIGAAVYAAISNATLAGQLAHPPAALSHALPHRLDAIGRTLTQHPAADVARYLRAAVHLAGQHVFLALLGTAVLALLVLLAAPRRFPLTADTTAPPAAGTPGTPAPGHGGGAARAD